MYVLNNIPLNLDLDQMIIDMRLSDRQNMADEFVVLAREAIPLANPKALFLEFEPVLKGDRTVQVSCETFESRVLRVNLEQSPLVFPALATCGLELDNWATDHDNILHQFWAKAIANEALSSAIKQLEKTIINKHNFNTISFMTPGSLTDWPIVQQDPLFRLIGAGADRIGVTLTDSYLMKPASTISCMVFQSETRFHSCMLCPKPDCHGRRAAFDSDMLSSKYRIDADSTETIPICQE